MTDSPLILLLPRRRSVCRVIGNHLHEGPRNVIVPVLRLYQRCHRHPPYSTANFFSGQSFKKGVTLAGHWRACQRTNTTGVGVTPPPQGGPQPAHENCCCNHRDATQTEISPQSRSFKELDLPTRAKPKTCEDCFFHLLGAFALSLLLTGVTKGKVGRKRSVETAAWPREQ